MIKNYLSYAVAAAFLASGLNSAALAQVSEKEPNDDPTTSAHSLVFDASKKVEVQGVIGINTLPPRSGDNPIADVDFYSFAGRAGEVVTINIDNGMKPAGSTERSLDSVIAIWGPGLPMRTRDDMDVGEEDQPEITNNKRDPRIEDVSLPKTGTYIVGVTGTGRMFLDNVTATAFVKRTAGNGSYRLIISVTPPPELAINIDIKPGLDRITNAKAKGTIPVLLLSSKDEKGLVTFDPLQADRSSIKFGLTGTEASGRCNRGPDANRDGLPDLMCHFDMEGTKLDEGHEEAVVRGNIGGMPFKGIGWAKVIPVKRPD